MMWIHKRFHYLRVARLGLGLIGLIVTGKAMALNEALEDQDQGQDEVAGIYQVTQARLSVNDCDKAGREVDYASKFIRFTPQEQGYRSEVCDGEDLDELDCSVSHSVFRMKEATKTGWQGFRYTARQRIAADGTPTCLLASARRRINLQGHGRLYYERSDWSQLVSDFQWECERAMAETYAESQSLQCNTHIVLELQKVLDEMPQAEEKAAPAEPQQGAGWSSK